MTCHSCAEKIQQVLRKIPAISRVEVDFLSKKAHITMVEHLGLGELNEALESLKKYKLHLESGQVDNMGSELSKKSLQTYWPLILLLLYIVFGTFYLAWNRGDYEWMNLMPDFMGLFFLSFGFFKLLDIKGFATSYLSYDLPTKAWPTWGYLYPFIEAGLGISFLFRWTPAWTNAITLVVMSASILGVIQSVLQKRKIKCVCLGTGFNLPMSTVTIIEDALMIMMAGTMLWFSV